MAHTESIVDVVLRTRVPSPRDIALRFVEDALRNEPTKELRRLAERLREDEFEKLGLENPHRGRIDSLIDAMWRHIHPGSKTSQLEDLLLLLQAQRFYELGVATRGRGSVFSTSHRRTDAPDPDPRIAELEKMLGSRSDRRATPPTASAQKDLMSRPEGVTPIEVVREYRARRRQSPDQPVILAELVQELQARQLQAVQDDEDLPTPGAVGRPNVRKYAVREFEKRVSRGETCESLQQEAHVVQQRLLDVYGKSLQLKTIKNAIGPAYHDLQKSARPRST